MDDSKNLVSAFTSILKKFSLQQKFTIGIVVVITVVMLSFVVFVFDDTNLAKLYTNMEPEDAAKVVEELSAKKVPYQLEDGGRTSNVAPNKEYELRLKTAEKVIQSSGVVGYEIFDKSTLGMSDFMQKLNFKRALEGELSRTITGQNGVQSARVHIVIPERSIFKDEQKPPTASVVLKLKSISGLSKDNIAAISHLVASSVEGLDPEKVTILDTKGRLLSREESDNSLASVSGKQYELKSNIENYLSKKAQNILDNVVGFGNSVVKLNVDLDFTQIDKTFENYDPESQIAISEQSITNQSKGRSISDSSAVVSNNSVTNYQLSKSIERVIQEAGNIKRITLAAVVNGITKKVEKNGATETVIEPRDDAQLEKLQQLISQAVGIDTRRKDQVSIVSIPFENNQFMDDTEIAAPESDYIKEYSPYATYLLAIFAALFVLKSLLKKLKNEKILIGTYNPTELVATGGSSESSGTAIATTSGNLIPNVKRNMVTIGDIEDEISDSAHEKRVRAEKISNYVAKNPIDDARLINAWIAEDEY